MAKRPDGSLYYLVFEAGHSTVKYSCSHALLTLLICEQAAPLLGWSQAWVDSVGRAALTMNVAMMRLQDQLAASQLTVSAAMPSWRCAEPLTDPDKPLLFRGLFSALPEGREADTRVGNPVFSRPAPSHPCAPT